MSELPEDKVSLANYSPTDAGETHGVPAVRLEAPRADAGRHSLAVRGDSADHRGSDCDGLRFHPVGLLAFAGGRGGDGSAAGGAPMLLAVSLLIFVVLGSVLEGIPVIVLFGPLLFLIARQLGVHEVQCSIVVVLAMGLGLFTPPLGVGYYATCAIGRVHPDKGIRPIGACMQALLVGTIVVATVPWFSIGFL